MKRIVEYAVEVLEHANATLTTEEITKRMPDPWKAERRDPSSSVYRALVDSCDWSVTAFRIVYHIHNGRIECFSLRSVDEAQQVKEKRERLKQLNDRLKPLLSEIHEVAACLRKELDGYPWKLDEAGGADLRGVNLQHAKADCDTIWPLKCDRPSGGGSSAKSM